MHAVLITAYRDFPALSRLVSRFDPEFFKIFIHIDKRSRISRAQIGELERLGASVVSRYSIRWGSITHLFAIIDLLRSAVDAGGIDYVHLISGQDYPLAGPAEFNRRCHGCIFMNFSPLSDESQYIKDRYWLRNFFYFLQAGLRGGGTLHRILDWPSRFFQKRLGLRRSRFGPFSTIYKGIMWMSFPAAAAAELIENPAAAAFLQAIRTTYLPEEIFFQTYFLNSHWRQSVENDDLRYADWRKRNGSIPAFLDQSDLQPILASNALFARKMSSDVSSELLDQIDAACFDGTAKGEAAE
jgi:hypothetical protein